VLTTFYSYGNVAPRRQGEIIQALANPAARGTSSADETAAAVVRALVERGMTVR